MGCDIHIIYKTKIKDVWKEVTVERTDGEDAPFDYRSYGLFAFLAGVRNFSKIKPISEPRGLPENWKPENREAVGFQSDSYQDGYFDGLHSKSWLTIEELLNYDYDQEIEDMRGCDQASGNMTGVKTSLRDFLGKNFFEELDILKQLCVDRIVFGFET